MVILLFLSLFRVSLFFILILDSHTEVFVILLIVIDRDIRISILSESLEALTVKIHSLQRFGLIDFSWWLTLRDACHTTANPGPAHLNFITLTRLTRQYNKSEDILVQDDRIRLDAIKG